MCWDTILCSYNLNCLSMRTILRKHPIPIILLAPNGMISIHSPYQMCWDIKMYINYPNCLSTRTMFRIHNLPGNLPIILSDLNSIKTTNWVIFRMITDAFTKTLIWITNLDTISFVEQNLWLAKQTNYPHYGPINTWFLNGLNTKLHCG